MTPKYEDASTIPYLLPAHRTKVKMSNTRMKQLLKAASRGFYDAPTRPRNDECCGSNCTPCVKDLWREEVLVWKQRWGIQDDIASVSRDASNDQTMSSKKSSQKVPGSFDW